MRHTKKRIISVATTAALLLSISAAVNAKDEGNIYLNNALLEDAQIVEHNDTTMIPLRAICENLGFTVNWIDESRTIELIKMPIYITCSPDRDGYTFSKTAPQLLGIAPQLIDDSTYVPTNFVNEILQGEISEEDGNIYINYGEQAPETTTVSGTVCDVIYKNDKITQIIIGDAEDVNTQTAFNISDEVYETIKDMNIVIGTEISVEVTDLQTMSIPPQMIAVSVTVVGETATSVVSGTVCDMIYEDEKLVKIVLGEKDAPDTQTILNLSEDMALKALELGINVGAVISAEVEDLATLSIPPQMIPVSLELVESSASKSTETVEGVICDLIYEDEKLVQIVIGDENDPMSQTVLNLTEELGAKALELKAEKGKTIKGTASMMKTRSIPAQQPLVSIEEIK